MWYLSYSVSCVDVFRGCLCDTDRGKGPDLTVIEARGLAKALEAYVFRVDPVKFGQSPDCIMPPAVNLATSSPTVHRKSYISVLSAGVTSGIVGSSMILPSKNSMI